MNKFFCFKQNKNAIQIKNINKTEIECDALGVSFKWIITKHKKYINATKCKTKIKFYRIELKGPLFHFAVTLLLFAFQKCSM